MDGVEAEVVADARRLGDALPAIVGLPQERPEADQGFFLRRQISSLGQRRAQTLVTCE